jgi:hypothetical protein
MVDIKGLFFTPVTEIGGDSQWQFGQGSLMMLIRTCKCATHRLPGVLSKAIESHIDLVFVQPNE